jgi:hypothetical protein
MFPTPYTRVVDAPSPMTVTTAKLASPSVTLVQSIDLGRDGIIRLHKMHFAISRWRQKAFANFI